MIIFKLTNSNGHFYESEYEYRPGAGTKYEV